MVRLPRDLLVQSDGSSTKFASELIFDLKLIFKKILTFKWNGTISAKIADHVIETDQSGDGTATT